MCIRDSHTAWYEDYPSDPRGNHILNELESLNILNSKHLPTRIPPQANQSPTSPDVTFCSPSLHHLLTWDTITDLQSDHLPILISLNSPHQPPTKKPLHTLTIKKQTGPNILI